MDNEIPLPPPPRIRHRAPNTPAVPSSLHKTYQQLSRFDDRSSQPSSDPALFSSDDIPASGLENYHAPAASGCRKRRYRGTWWGEMVKDTKRKRVDFKDKRLVDSGVWMGSDDSGIDSLLLSEDASIWGEELLHHSTVGRTGDVAPGETTAGAQQRVVFKKVEESREHQLARAIVNDCLEKGQDSVDLRLDFFFPSFLRRHALTSTVSVVYNKSLKACSAPCNTSPNYPRSRNLPSPKMFTAP